VLLALSANDKIEVIDKWCLFSVSRLDYLSRHATLKHI